MEPTPHVLILPFPAQGHVKPMLTLATLLSHAGLRVTFATSQAVLDPLLRHLHLPSFTAAFPSLRFAPLPDGFPTRATTNRHNPSLSQLLAEAFAVTANVTPRLFRELLADLFEKEGEAPTCVVADGIMSFAIEAAGEFGIPVVAFRTYGATSTWVYFHLQTLIDQGLIPFQQGEMDRPIRCIPGLEDIIRLRDLPGFCRQRNSDEGAMLQFFLDQTSAMRKASALILNTFNELEPGPVAQLGSIFPRVYTLGPLQALSKQIIPNSDSDGSLWKKDRACMTWLDRQQPNSVLYVSFGSFLTLTRDQRLEIWHGVVDSGKPFMWVARAGSILYESASDDNIPDELLIATRDRGLVVEWVPQEEVLAHRAVGGFLTHCGWNSTLESVSAGVGMIGWPGLADQQVNSRCVEEIWKVGIDVKDTCDRRTVESAVRRLMEGGDQGMAARVAELRRSAVRSVEAGGSSHCNLMKLIEDVSKMSSKSTLR
uniref:Glycosyltransferase N-terminal domain-containing protein n=1 Tax=Kalanchoe fedtschenkoi TaxID=63787 RepID=A0A7N0UJH7_KALFE